MYTEERVPADMLTNCVTFVFEVKLKKHYFCWTCAGLVIDTLSGSGLDKDYNMQVYIMPIFFFMCKKKNFCMQFGLK